MLSISIILGNQVHSRDFPLFLSLSLSRFLPLYKEQAMLNFHGNCMHFGHGIRTGAQEGGGEGPYKANMYFAIRWQFEVDGNQRRLFVCFVQATNKQITNNKLTNRQANKPEQKLELSEKQPSLDLALASYQHSLQLERINW